VERTLQDQLDRAAELGDGELAVGPGALWEVAPEDQSMPLTRSVHGVEQPRLAARSARETLEPHNFDRCGKLLPECRGERLRKLTGSRHLTHGLYETTRRR
jgi:hypothetical protein